MVAGVNVILLLPPTSPSDVPVHGIVAPAAVISLKSTFVSETAAAVIVRGVPSVLERQPNLTPDDRPVIVSVPVTVKLAAKFGSLAFVVMPVVPVNVKLAHVNAPEIFNPIPMR